ncbi:MAG: hypothetical protein AABX48_02745 [Nanoarchaeota archaeon]
MKKRYSKKIAGAFSLAGFIGSIFFLNFSSTGNIIINEASKTNSGLISLIGVCLLICSAILAARALR